MPAINVGLGSGLGGVGIGSMSLSGVIKLVTEATAAEYLLTNPNSPCYVQDVNLANGTNPIDIPEKAGGVLIMPHQEMDFQITLKGVFADTGTALAKRGVALLTFESPPPASFDLSWLGRALFEEACTADNATDYISKTAHGLANGDRVYFRAGTGGSVPGGLTDGVLYYVINKTADTFQVAFSAGGTAIDLTSTGSSVLLSTIDNVKLFWF